MSLENSQRFICNFPSKLIMFIIYLKTSSKDGSAYRFPRGLYLTVSQTACLSCRSCALLCVLIQVPFRKLIIDNSLMWQSGNVALWHFSVLHFHFMPVFAISLLYPAVSFPVCPYLFPLFLRTIITKSIMQQSRKP